MEAPLELSFRQATLDDLPAILAMLADDPLGAKREHVTSPLSEAYLDAFHAIDADANNELTVACANAQIAGVLQLTFIPYLTYQGSWRALIEGVRVAEDYRSKGVGKAFFEWTIERAKVRGCCMVQLTTDKARPEAKRFYESLGFQATHEGVKLRLQREILLNAPLGRAESPPRHWLAPHPSYLPDLRSQESTDIQQSRHHLRQGQASAVEVD